MFKEIFETKKSRIQDYLNQKTDKDREKWILKNLSPYSKMKPRKTKNGWNVTPTSGKTWMIEFSYGEGYVYPEDFKDTGGEDRAENLAQLPRVIKFPEAFFIYDKKFGTPIKEIWMEEFFQDWVTQHIRGW